MTDIFGVYHEGLPILFFTHSCIRFYGNAVWKIFLLFSNLSIHFYFITHSTQRYSILDTFLPCSRGLIITFVIAGLKGVFGYAANSLSAHFEVSYTTNLSAPSF